MDSVSLTDVDPNCPFDCCTVWKGKIPFVASNLKMNTDQFLRFLSTKKRSNYISKVKMAVAPAVDQVILPKPKVIVKLVKSALPIQSESQKQQVEQHNSATTSTTSALSSLLLKNTVMETSSIQSLLNLTQQQDKLHNNEPTACRHPPTAKPTPTIYTLNLVTCEYCGRFCLSENDLRKHLIENHPMEFTRSLYGNSCSRCSAAHNLNLRHLQTLYENIYSSL